MARWMGMAIIFFLLPRDLSASGTWSVVDESDWYLGQGINLDFITASGTLKVRRNFSETFDYAGGDYDPLPGYWRCDQNYCQYQRTATPGSIRLVSPITSEWVGNYD